MGTRTVALMSALYPIARPTAIGGVEGNASVPKRTTPGLVRSEQMRSAVGVDLRCHHTFGAGAEPHQNSLARTQFRDAIAPQGLHVNEDIRRAFAAGEE